MAKCFTEVTHVSLKYLQYFTATGSLTYILGAFRVLRSVLFVQDNVDSDLRVRFEKKKKRKEFSLETGMAKVNVSSLRRNAINCRHCLPQRSTL